MSYETRTDLREGLKALYWQGLVDNFEVPWASRALDLLTDKVWEGETLPVAEELVIRQVAYEKAESARRVEAAKTKGLKQ